jgi:hypothetical protein
LFPLEWTTLRFDFFFPCRVLFNIVHSWTGMYCHVISCVETSCIEMPAHHSEFGDSCACAPETSWLSLHRGEFDLPR